MKNARTLCLHTAAAIAALAGLSSGAVTLPPAFANHMVLQRGSATPVFGKASPGEKVTVAFAGQTISVTADASGNWRVELADLAVNAAPQTMTVTGSNTLTLTDVLVGDVWLCSGQSNMATGLGGYAQPGDIENADYPGIRRFNVGRGEMGYGDKAYTGIWSVCSPTSAGGYSATAFYFARKVYLELERKVPIGIIVTAVGGTTIDLWTPPEGVIDKPVLKPLLANPPERGTAFSLYNGQVYPVAPYRIKGLIWYQGENSEKTVLSPNSYFLKLKALQEGWRNAWEMDDLPFYLVMIADYGPLPKNNVPDTIAGGGWDSDTRLQQAMALNLPHAGVASAIDIGDTAAMHPKDKLEVGERLALWALKNEYGRADLVTSGPVLKDAVLSGATISCSFDYVGSGLIAGKKEWFKPIVEDAGGLKRFVIAGADGKWYPAKAVINGNKVICSSDSVAAPRKIAYATWGDPFGSNLYNREGLPANPFYVGDVTKYWRIAASAEAGGTISPAGTDSVHQRSTVLYTIQPNDGYHIQDVVVDGISVGSVPSYTFEPVYADHTIKATFSKTKPTYTLKASAPPGFTISPSGSIPVPQGGTVRFTLRGKDTTVPTALIDGVPIGGRFEYTFTNVRKNHAIGPDFTTAIRDADPAVPDARASVSANGGRISIAFPEGKPRRIELLTPDGKTVSTLQVTRLQNRAAFKPTLPGMYVVRITETEKAGSSRYAKAVYLGN